MRPTHHHQRIPSLIIGLALLVLLSLAGALWAPPPADAKITNQGGGPVASIVDCIRSGESFSGSSHDSPRFALACMGGAWGRTSYNFDTTSAAGDAARAFPAIVAFGDGRPDGPGEPGHQTLAALGNDGTRAGSTGLGTVFGLAYSSGTNPAIPAALPATQRRGHLFAAAYLKRVTRFGAGGPGGIYLIDPETQATRLYAQVPGVVAGPAPVGDGSAATFPNHGWPGSSPYMPEMGGLHVLDHDHFARPLIGMAGLGGLTMSQDERYLVGVNLRQRNLFFIDTWSTAVPPPVQTAPIDASVAACPGGPANFRPFAVTYDHPTTPATEYVPYIGYVCSAETTQNRADLRAGVLRGGSGPTTRVLDFPLAAYDAQRASPAWMAAIGERTRWYPWSDSLYVTAPNTRQQPMLTDLAFAEDGSLLLGFRSRTMDMGTTERVPSEFVLGEGDLLRAEPSGSGGWNAPSPAGTELYRDEGGFFNPGEPRLTESTSGAIAYVPGTASGAVGGEVVTTAAYPHLAVNAVAPHTSGALWFDARGGAPTAREQTYHGGGTSSGFKAAGLGDMEILCAWRAIGNRVWRDANGNGIQDAGEPDVSGVRLQLLDAGGTVISTVTTGTVSGAGDSWRFYVHPHRAYTVRIDPTMFNAGQPLAGLAPTLPRVGVDRERDNDANAAGVVSITAGPRSQVDLSYDIGLIAGSDVWMTKTGPATAAAGATFSYTLSYGNRTGTAQGVVLRDTLPAGLTYVSAAPAPSSVGGQVLSWNLGALTAGQSGSVTLTVRAATSFAPATATSWARQNCAVISTTSLDNDPSNNNACATTTLQRPELSVTKSGPATAAAGASFSYSLRYRNLGPRDAAGVVLRDTLPAGLSYVAASPAPSSVSGQVLTWNRGALAAGGDVTVSLTVRAASAFTPATALSWARQNCVTISTTSQGDTTTGNTSCATTTLQRPEISVTKTGPATAPVGDELVYTLGYGNRGSLAAAGVVLRDTLPTGLTYTAATPAPSSVSGQVLTWNLGPLAATTTGTITMRARATIGVAAAVVNQAAISTSSTGDDPSDNSTTWTTAILFPDPLVTISLSDPLPVGAWRTATLSYHNQGTGLARASVLTATLEAGTQLGMLPGGCVQIADAPVVTGAPAGPRVQCDLGDLAVNATGTRALPLRLPATPDDGVSFAGDQLRLAARIDTATPERSTTLANNSALATVSVVRPNAFVQVTALNKSLPSYEAGWLSYLRFRVGYGNDVASATLPANLRRPSNLTLPAAGTTLTVTLPLNSDLAAVNAVGGGAAPSYQLGADGAGNPALIFDLGTLAARASGGLEVTVRTREAPGAQVALAAQISTTTPGDEPVDNTAQDAMNIVQPPTSVEGTGDLRLAIHSTLDPQHGGASATDAVYLSEGTSITWPAGEVLDFTPRLSSLVIRDPLTSSDPLAPYAYRARVTGWSLVSFGHGGQTVDARTDADAWSRAGCRTGWAALSGTSLPGCTYAYPGATSEGVDPRDALPPYALRESDMAGQGHVYWTHQGMPGTPLPTMRPDVYLFALPELRPVTITVAVEAEVWVVNLYPGAPVGDWTLPPEELTSIPRMRESYPGTFTVTLLVPRSVVGPGS